MSSLDEREAAVDRRLRYQREKLVRCLDWQRERKSAQAAYELQKRLEDGCKTNVGPA